MQIEQWISNYLHAVRYLTQTKLVHSQIESINYPVQTHLSNTVYQHSYQIHGTAKG